MPPPGVGVCPCRVTPALTSILRFLNDRATVRTTSSSHPLRMVGSASNTVTEVPRSENMEANSHPIAPPPMTATDAGRLSRASTSSEVSTTVPSMSNPGIVRGTEPAARTTSVPEISVEVPSFPAMRTRLPARSVPLPLNTVTPRPFSSPDRPENSWSTTCCLRSWLTENLTTGSAWSPPDAMPKSAADRTVRRTAAVSRNALAGTQPRCRQVPPTLSSSTSPIDSPAEAP